MMPQYLHKRFLEELHVCHVKVSRMSCMSFCRLGRITGFSSLAQAAADVIRFWFEELTTDDWPGSRDRASSRKGRHQLGVGCVGHRGNNFPRRCPLPRAPNKLWDPYTCAVMFQLAERSGSGSLLLLRRRYGSNTLRTRHAGCHQMHEGTHTPLH